MQNAILFCSFYTLFIISLFANGFSECVVIGFRSEIQHIVGHRYVQCLTQQGKHPGIGLIGRIFPDVHIIHTKVKMYCSGYCRAAALTGIAGTKDSLRSFRNTLDKLRHPHCSLPGQTSARYLHIQILIDFCNVGYSQSVFFYLIGRADHRHSIYRRILQNRI